MEDRWQKFGDFQHYWPAGLFKEPTGHLNWPIGQVADSDQKWSAMSLSGRQPLLVSGSELLAFLCAKDAENLSLILHRKRAFVLFIE